MPIVTSSTLRTVTPRFASFSTCSLQLLSVTITSHLSPASSSSLSLSTSLADAIRAPAIGSTSSSIVRASLMHPRDCAPRGTTNARLPASSGARRAAASVSTRLNPCLFSNVGSRQRWLSADTKRISRVEASSHDSPTTCSPAAQAHSMFLERPNCGPVSRSVATDGSVTMDPPRPFIVISICLSWHSNRLLRSTRTPPRPPPPSSLSFLFFRLDSTFSLLVRATPGAASVICSSSSNAPSVTALVAGFLTARLSWC
mmetsp:Transcript_14190/g.34417  ORF Transcript_14190/g.34417 Transcript_14190/m.34417 type:complete len:257 (-) Transcript_14190:804-1574(-)